MSGLDILGEFIENAGAVETLEQLQNSFLQTIKPLGFDHFTCVTLTNLNRPVRNAIRLLEFPRAWTRHYLDNNFMEFDPVFPEVLQNHLPMTWQEILKRHRRTPGVENLFRMAAEAGLTAGVTIPIHRPNRLPAMVNAAGPDNSLDPNAVHLLHLLSFYLLERAEQLTEGSADKADSGSRGDRDGKDARLLTPREKDCLLWAAYGKTDRQIAELLSISHNTAHRHLENAKRKLGAASRAHAISIALQLGEIVL